MVTNCFMVLGKKKEKISPKRLRIRGLCFYICSHILRLAVERAPARGAPTHTITPTPHFADVAQLVERNLAKVEVAGSNLVIRSLPSSEGFFFDLLRKAFF